MVERRQARLRWSWVVDGHVCGGEWWRRMWSGGGAEEVEVASVRKKSIEGEEIKQGEGRSVYIR